MKNDDDLGRDLAAATGRDLPDEDIFAERVMHGIEGGGGERTLALGLPRRARLWPAAAALLVGVVAGALFFGRGAGPAGFGAASPGELDLPAATTGEALPGPIRIRVAAGETVDFEALRARLLEATRVPASSLSSRIEDTLIDPLREEVKPDIAETKPIEEDENVVEDPVIKDAKVPDFVTDEPFEVDESGKVHPPKDDGTTESDEPFSAGARGSPRHSVPRAGSRRDVLLLADRSVPWRTIQWVLQTCADPKVGLWRIHWGVAGDRAIPVFLPMDRGIRTLKQLQAGQMSLKLRRTAGENATHIEYGGRDLGEGAEAFENLKAALEFAPPSVLTIDGSPAVPYGEVVTAVDQARKAGVRRFTLVGAPPPKK